MEIMDNVCKLSTKEKKVKWVEPNGRSLKRITQLVRVASET